MNLLATDLRVGDLLVHTGLLTADELERLIESARQHNVHVGQLLIAEGIVSKVAFHAVIDAQSAIRDNLCDAPSAIRALRNAIKSGINFSEALFMQEGASAVGGQSNKLGDILRQAGLVTAPQLKTALTESKATGLPLGRCLVLTGSISESLLELVLEMQIRIRDGMMSRDEAIAALRSGNGERPVLPGDLKRMSRAKRVHAVRIGEMLSAADIVNNQKILEAQEEALAQGTKIGQILIKKRLIDDLILEAALAVQRMVDSKFLNDLQASALLAHAHRKKVSVSQALVDLRYVKRRKFTTFSEICLPELATKPAIESNFEPPSASPPLAGGSAPAVEEGGSAPAVEGGSAPAVEEDSSAPAVEGGSAPAVEDSSAPAVEEDSSAPAVEEDSSAPAVEGGSAPAVEEGGSAPAQSENMARAFTRSMAERLEYLDALSTAHNTIAVISLDRGDYKEAQENFVRVIEIKLQLHGQNSKEIIDDLLNLAAVLYLQGMHLECSQFIESAIYILEQLCPPEPHLMANCLNSLARVYVQLGMLKEAEPLFSQALAINEIHHSGRSAEIIESLKGYARLLATSNRKEEADRFYSEARLIANGHIND